MALLVGLALIDRFLLAKWARHLPAGQHWLAAGCVRLAVVVVSSCSLLVRPGSVWLPPGDSLVLPDPLWVPFGVEALAPDTG